MKRRNLFGLKSSSLFLKLSRWPQELAILAIETYRVILAPTFGGVCRFEPSCSRYASEAYSRFGFLKGTYLTLKRLFSCRPGGRFGYDPVPCAAHSDSKADFNSKFSQSSEKQR